MAKDYFQANNISYSEFDVASDTERRKEMMEKSGQLGVPVILIDDDIVIGFNKSRRAKLLSIPNTPNVTPVI